MTAELSRELALALGYAPESVRVCTPTYCEVFRHRGPDYAYTPKEEWRRFDYTAPDAAMPLLKWIGEQYRVFFWWCSPTDKRGALWSSSNGVIADTLEEAIARACIAVKGKP